MNKSELMCVHLLKDHLLIMKQKGFYHELTPSISLLLHTYVCTCMYNICNLELKFFDGHS